MKKISLFFICYISTSYTIPPLPPQIATYCEKHQQDSKVQKLIQTLELIKSIKDEKHKALLVYRAVHELTDRLRKSITDFNEIYRQTLECNKIPFPDDQRTILPPIATRNQYQLEVSGAAAAVAPLLPALSPRPSYIEAAYRSPITFAHIIGEIPAEILDLGKILTHDKHYLDVGVRKPFGVLFHGPPGTGKSLLAKAIAGEYKIPLIQRSGSSFINKYVGTGANNLREMFEEALALLQRYDEVIIFIDELDAIGGSRSADDNAESTRTIIQLMTIMDGGDQIKIDKERITLIATTNRLEDLDVALIRSGRFDHKIEIKEPDFNKRALILEHYLKSKPRLLKETINIEELAAETNHLNCADLENLVNKAALYAARRKDGLSNDDFMQALHDIKPPQEQLFYVS